MIRGFPNGETRWRKPPASGNWLVVARNWYNLECMRTYKELDVYKRSYTLAVRIHRLSLKLPREYKFELADQIRRASRSIPSNIAEGFGRGKSKKDTISHLRDSLGSNDEMPFNIEFMKDVNLIANETFHELFDEYTITGKQLTGLIRSLELPETSNQ